MQYDKHFNIVTDFLAFHDYQPNKHYDLILVLGSAIPSVSLAAYKLYLEGQSTYFMIAGGIGHTTDLLIKNLPGCICHENKSEAALLKEYIEITFNKDDSILLEQNSTNCGLNISYAFQELESKNISVQTVLLCHDPLLQRRIDLTAKKQYPNICFSNFCAFIPEVKIIDNQLQLVNKAIDQWPIDRYLSLTLGEMSRIYDDEFGYGPKGANYICHQDIPKNVENSYSILKKEYQTSISK